MKVISQGTWEGRGGAGGHGRTAPEVEGKEEKMRCRIGTQELEKGHKEREILTEGMRD